MTTFRALSDTERTKLNRLRERGRTERAELYDVLDAGMICHFGVIIDGTPVVLPTGYGRVEDTLYLHGSSANRAFRAGAGQDVCVTVTLLDGLVLARAGFHNSMNYRSAVIYGVARAVTDSAEHVKALRVISDHLVPGHWDYSRPTTRKELAATAVLAVPLAEASVKARSGWPKDDDEDYDLDLWAGVLPAALTFAAAVPDPKLKAGVEVPAHVADLEWRARGGTRPA